MAALIEITHPFRRPGSLVAGLLCWLLLPGTVYAGSADLTRYLGDHVRSTGKPVPAENAFGASEGTGRVIVTRVDGANPVTSALVSINGITVLGPDDFKRENDEIEVPVELDEENTISVIVRGKPGSALRVRVKQAVDVALNITNRIHFNTQVSDFETAKAFYTDLGFVNAFGFPSTNTLEVAEAIGVETPTSYDGSQGPEAGGYLLRVELIALANFGGSFIDLIEFTIPRNDDPPYPFLYHLGIARAALRTTDIDADYNDLLSRGVEFLSAPATRSNGQRFVIFKDPDGTFYELTEVEGPKIPGAATNINSIGRININVSDFERSQGFYQLLGFEPAGALPATDTLEVAQALGLDREYTLRGELLAFPGDGSMIELVQWLDPVDLAPPYALPVNHIGIHRTAYSTTDLSADVAALKAVGVKFLTEIAPCCSGPDSPSGIISFLDPDGTVFELVGPISRD